MTPYYEQDGITIYHGDCLEMLPVPADVLVTDPPFGQSWRSGFGGVRGNCAVANDHSTHARDHVLSYWSESPAVVFGTWKCTRPLGIRAILIWDKGPHVGAGDLSLPWKPNTEEIYILGPGFKGHRGSSVLTFWAPSPNFKERLHPTEKPESLMFALMAKCPSGTILDPFMGSGTTLVAAKRLGRTAIGIELDERYCEIAATRLSQGALPLEMA